MGLNFSHIVLFFLLLAAPVANAQKHILTPRQAIVVQDFDIAPEESKAFLNLIDAVASYDTLDMQLARLEDGIYLEFATGEMIWVANDLSGPFVRALRNIFPLGGVSDINWFDRSDHHQGSSQHRYNPSQDTYALLFLPTPKSIRVSLFVSDIKVKDNKGFIRKGFTVGMEVPFQYNPDDNTIRLIFKDHYIEEMIQKDLDALAKKRKRRKPHISYRYSLHEFALEGANLYVTFQPNNSGL